MDVKGDLLTITVDLAKDFGPSASGKTIVIASSKGNVPVSGTDTGAVIGLNVYRKNK
jgi:hypothetical protein